MIIKVRTTFRENKSRKDDAEEKDGYWEPVKSDEEFWKLTKVLDKIGVQDLEYMEG